MLEAGNYEKLTSPTMIARKPRRSNASQFLLAKLFAILLASIFVAPVFAQGEGGGPRDDSGVRLPDIARNYRERFPYAKEAANKDRVNDGKSEKGSTKTYKAYTRVRRKCTDGLGTMNGEKCDVEEGEKYCAEECEEDQCPPEGEHCPVTPHYNWAQDEQQASVQLLTARDEEAVEKGLIPTKGLPMSDTLYQVIDRENKQRLLELMFDPERWMWTETGMGQMQVSSLANSLGGAAEASFACAVGTIQGRLVNVADERQSSGDSGGGRGDAGKAVQVVQKIYKEIFLPMAFLLLLPGAILTQFKGMVGAVITGADEDSINPFTGIIRAVIAGFLIVCTPLIVSYCIDTGNVLAEEVVKPDRGWIQEKVVTKWAKEQTFNPSPENVNNAIPVSGQGSNTSEGGQQQGSGGQQQSGGGQQQSGGGQQQGGGGQQQSAAGQQGGGGSASVIINVGPLFGQSTGNPAVDAFNHFVSSLFGNQNQKQQSSSSDQGGGEGKAAGQLEGQVTQEDQLFLSSAMQVGFNALSLGMGETLNMLAAYQLVFMCYLFLMGPIAACFYAWPAGIGGLFKKVFSNWLDAVVVLSLWRFWWCVILAVMTQRINYLHPNAGSPSEMMVYNCFLALLLYIPFQPFNFKPGDMVSRVLEQAGVGAGGGGEGGGGHGGLQGEHADASDGGVSGRSASPTVRRDSRAGREMAALAGGTAGRSTRMPAMSSGLAAARQVSAPPPMADHQAKAGKAVTGHSSAVPAVASVPGRAVSASPPPLTAPAGGSVQPNPALDAVRTQYPGANVESIANGAPPTVPLAATSEPRVFLNTANPALAQNGMQAWGNGLASRNQMPEKQNSESSTGGKNGDVGLPPSRS